MVITFRETKQRPSVKYGTNYEYYKRNKTPLSSEVQN